MADDKGYSWQCIRDGADTKEVCANPLLGNVLNRMHAEYHNSRDGRNAEEPEYGGDPSFLVDRK